MLDISLFTSRAVFYIAGLLIIANFAFAQSNNIIVHDQITGEPLDQVLVTQNKTEIYFTNARGQLIIKNLNPGDSIVFTSLGYQIKTLTGDSLLSGNHQIGLTPNPFNLDEVTVSANRFEEPSDDIPYQLLQISKNEIKRISPDNSGDLLQSTGMVNVQKSQAGGGSPVLRGFEANKILIVVDGIRMNNAIYRAGHLQNVITIDPLLLEKVEVLFGPGSVMYGSDALGGVMHFISRDPILAKNPKNTYTSGNLTTKFATANTAATGHIDFTISNDKLGSLTSLTYSSFDDVRMGSERKDQPDDWGKRFYYQEFSNGRDTVFENSDPNVQKYTGYDQIDFLQKFLYKPADNTSHVLNIQFSRSGDIPRYDRLTDTLPDGTFRYGEWFYGPQIRGLAAYTIKHESVSKLIDNINTTLAYQFIEESRNTRSFGSLIRSERLEQLHILSFNTDIEKRVSLSEFRYGMEVFYNRVNSSAEQKNIISGSTADISTRYPSGGSDYSAVSLYITHKREINKFVLEQGLRFNYTGLTANFGDTAFYKLQVGDYKENYSAISGVVGFIYQPSEALRFNITGATGFRSPNLDDLSKVFDSNSGTVIVPNQDLKPEYTYNCEGGFTYRHNEIVMFSGTAWYTLYKDAIVTRRATWNGADSIIYDGVLSEVYANQNAGSAYIYGFNGSVRVNLSKQWTLEGTITKTKGVITSTSQKEPLDHIPPMFGKFSLSYSRSKLRVTAYSLFNEKKSVDEYGNSGEDNIQYATADGMPAWITYNLQIEFMPTVYASIKAKVENVLDSHYRVFSSGISAPGRNLVVTLSAWF